MWTGSGALFASSGPHLSVGDILEDILSTPADTAGPSSSSTADARRGPATQQQRHKSSLEELQRDCARRIQEVPAGKEAQLQGTLQATLHELQVALRASSMEPMQGAQLPHNPPASSWVELTQEVCATLTAADAVLLESRVAFTALPEKVQALQSIVERMERVLTDLHTELSSRDYADNEQRVSLV